MSIHKLKTWPKYFQAVKSGDKTVEIRKNDRGYKVKDILVLQEYDPETKQYTGDEIAKAVSHIVDEQPFVSEGYVAMSIY